MGHVPTASKTPPWEEHPSWPRFFNPGPATIIAMAVVLAIATVLVITLSRALQRRLARRRAGGFVVTAPSKTGAARPTSLTSELEIESRQLLFPDRADPGERLPLCGGARNQRPLRGSLYDTFQIPPSSPPPPNTRRLKQARSMMQLSNGHPLAYPGKDLSKKSKTIHWHGVNQLNTAWGWMS